MAFFFSRGDSFHPGCFYKENFGYFHLTMFLKTYLIILLIFLVGTAFQPADLIKAKWLVLKGGTLHVTGSTNINTFKCIIPDYSIPDTLTCFRPVGKELSIPMTGHVSLTIFSFDCHNNMMTADLRKTLKAKDFPKLNIYFLSLKKFPELKLVQESITGMVNIELAGITKKFEVNYTLYMDDQKVIHLVGTKSINFSDFNITPPRKLGGIIQTRDKLDVEFHLSLKNIAL